MTTKITTSTRSIEVNNFLDEQTVITMSYQGIDSAGSISTGLNRDENQTLARAAINSDGWVRDSKDLRFWWGKKPVYVATISEEGLITIHDPVLMNYEWTRFTMRNSLCAAVWVDLLEPPRLEIKQ